MISHVLRNAATVAMAAAVFTTTAGGAQGRTEAPFATRASLQARAAAADAAARHTPDRKVWEENVAELMSVRERLRDGDFNIGDRVAVRVANVPALTDTFTVRAGRVLELPDVGSIPLSGVLWSELTPHLTKQISRFVVNPNIEAHPLLRVAVSGSVTKPGFYSVRPDMLVSDAIMSAGGASPVANLEETTIRRNGKEIWKAKRLRQEMAAGATVDQLDLRAGDEIFVAEQSKRDWGEWIRTGAYVGAVLVSLYGGTRIFR
jgi:protein involved in polysaccharide export with SLBB domain